MAVDAKDKEFWTKAGYDPAVFDGPKLANADLAKNAGWLKAAEIIYASRNDGKPSGMKPEELSQWALERMSWYNHNSGAFAAQSAQILSGTKEQKAAFLYLMELNEHTQTEMGDIGRAVGRMATDPLTYLGIGTLGAGLLVKQGAATTAKAGAKLTLKESIKAGFKVATVTGAIEGALSTSTRDIGKQWVEVSAEKKSEFSTLGFAGSTLAGATTGATFGSAFAVVAPAAGHALSHTSITNKVNEAVEWAYSTRVGGALKKPFEWVGAGKATAARYGARELPSVATTLKSRDFTDHITRSYRKNMIDIFGDGDPKATSLISKSTDVAKTLDDIANDLATNPTLTPALSSRVINAVDESANNILEMKAASQRLKDELKAVQDRLDFLNPPAGAPGKRAVHEDVMSARTKLLNLPVIINGHIPFVFNPGGIARNLPYFPGERLRLREANGLSQLNSVIRTQIDDLDRIIEAKSLAHSQNAGDIANLLGAHPVDTLALSGALDKMKKNSQTLAEELIHRVGDGDPLKVTIEERGTSYERTFKDWLLSEENKSQGRQYRTEIERSIREGYINPHQRTLKIIRPDNPNQPENAERYSMDVEDFWKGNKVNVENARQLATALFEMYKNGMDQEALYGLRHMAYAQGGSPSKKFGNSELKSTTYFPADTINQLDAQYKIVGKDPATDQHYQHFRKALDKVITEGKGTHNPAHWMLGGQRAVQELYQSSTYWPRYAFRHSGTDWMAKPGHLYYYQEPLRFYVYRRFNFDYMTGKSINDAETKKAMADDSLKFKFVFDDNTPTKTRLMNMAGRMIKEPFFIPLDKFVIGGAKYGSLGSLSITSAKIAGLAAVPWGIEEGYEAYTGENSKLDIGSRVWSAQLMLLDNSPLMWGARKIPGANEIFDLEKNGVRDFVRTKLGDRVTAPAATVTPTPAAAAAPANGTTPAPAATGGAVAPAASTPAPTPAASAPAAAAAGAAAVTPDEAAPVSAATAPTAIVDYDSKLKALRQKLQDTSSPLTEAQTDENKKAQELARAKERNDAAQKDFKEANAAYTTLISRDEKLRKENAARETKLAQAKDDTEKKKLTDATAAANRELVQIAAALPNAKAVKEKYEPVADKTKEALAVAATSHRDAKRLLDERVRERQEISTNIIATEQDRALRAIDIHMQSIDKDDPLRAKTQAALQAFYNISTKSEGIAFGVGSKPGQKAPEIDFTNPVFLEQAKALAASGKFEDLKGFTDSNQVQSAYNAAKMKAGTKTEVRADGSKLETRPDGSKLETRTDGSTLETKANGLKVETKADGTKVVTNPNGSVATPQGTTSGTGSTGSGIGTWSEAGDKAIRGVSNIAGAIGDGLESQSGWLGDGTFVRGVRDTLGGTFGLAGNFLSDLKNNRIENGSRILGIGGGILAAIIGTNVIKSMLPSWAQKIPGLGLLMAVGIFLFAGRMINDATAKNRPDAGAGQGSGKFIPTSTTPAQTVPHAGGAATAVVPTALSVKSVDGQQMTFNVTDADNDSHFAIQSIGMKDGKTFANLNVLNGEAAIQAQTQGNVIHVPRAVFENRKFESAKGDVVNSPASTALREDGSQDNKELAIVLRTGTDGQVIVIDPAIHDERDAANKRSTPAAPANESDAGPSGP